MDIDIMYKAMIAITDALPLTSWQQHTDPDTTLERFPENGRYTIWIEIKPQSVIINLYTFPIKYYQYTCILFSLSKIPNARDSYNRGVLLKRCQPFDYPKQKLRQAKSTLDCQSNVPT